MQSTTTTEIDFSNMTPQQLIIESLSSRDKLTMALASALNNALEIIERLGGYDEGIEAVKAAERAVARASRGNT